MLKNTVFKILIVTLLFAFLFCNDEPRKVLQPEEVTYGSLSGKVLNPDNDLIIRVIDGGGIDTATRNPETQAFTFDSIRYGNCFLQVMKEGYGLFEKKILLDKPLFVCNDIVITKTPRQVSYVDPSNSQNLDSQFCVLHESSITDSGFLIAISFNDKMDTASVEDALTILPDTSGVQIDWVIRLSLSLFFPNWKLATTDTIKVKLSRKALNQWNDTLDQDLELFYPIDTNYIRTTRLKK